MSKKKLIFVSLICVVGGYFTSIGIVTMQYSLISSLFVLLFALPSYYYLSQLVGVYTAVRTIFLLSVFALLLESFAVWSGFPYGRFVYTDLIGYRLFGLVPWTVPFAWVPLVIGSYVVSRQLSQITWVQVALAALLMVGVDLLIDPGAVSLQFWKWSGTPWWYGIPASNYLGWFFSGVIGNALLRKSCSIELQTDRNTLIRGSYSSFYLITFFWMSVVTFRGLYLASMVGIVLLYILYRLRLSRI